MTCSEIIQKLGGTSNFSEIVGVPYPTAASMKARNSIPVKYWVKIVDYSAQHNIEGVTFNSLAASNSKET